MSFGLLVLKDFWVVGFPVPDYLFKRIWCSTFRYLCPSTAFKLTCIVLYSLVSILIILVIKFYFYFLGLPIWIDLWYTNNEWTRHTASWLSVIQERCPRHRIQVIRAEGRNNSERATYTKHQINSFLRANVEWKMYMKSTNYANYLSDDNIRQ